MHPLSVGGLPCVGCSRGHLFLGRPCRTSSGPVWSSVSLVPTRAGLAPVVWLCLEPLPGLSNCPSSVLSLACQLLRACLGLSSGRRWLVLIRAVTGPPSCRGLDLALSWTCPWVVTLPRAQLGLTWTCPWLVTLPRARLDLSWACPRRVALSRTCLALSWNLPGLSDCRRSACAALAAAARPL